MSEEATLDVVAIGNAIVDVLAQADDGFLEAHGLAKGTMTLVDAARSDEIYAAMPPAIEMSGGSAANLIAGMSSLGARVAYIGKVRDDQLGEAFRHDMRAIGVRFETAPASAGPATARCLIMVTPDAQRTMQTYLGASTELTADDVPPEIITAARVTYVEGYLWDGPSTQGAFMRAVELAHKAGRKVAFTLSDPFCVERHRASFLELVREHVDVLFANEHEIMALYEAPDFDAALQAVRGQCGVVALTRSALGSVVVSGDELHVIDAARVEALVDTTGAGDLYAAGFLYGLTHGYGLAACGRLASVCAAEVISHAGARPQMRLAELVEQP